MFKIGWIMSGLKTNIATKKPIANKKIPPKKEEKSLLNKFLPTQNIMPNGNNTTNNILKNFFIIPLKGNFTYLSRSLKIAKLPTIVIGAMQFLLPTRRKTKGKLPTIIAHLSCKMQKQLYNYSITLFLSCQEFMTKFFIS